MACTGVESLLTSLCSQDLDGADESFKVELYKDLEKCLHYGVMLCKADPSKCDWYTGLLLRLFRIPQVSGDFTCICSLWLVLLLVKVVSN